MTKEEIKTVVKRYPYITKAIRQQMDPAIFYIGKRRQVVAITDGVKTVCEVIDIIYVREKNNFVKKILKGLITETGDVSIIQDVPYQKNAYQDRKQAVLNKIYDCCVSRGVVSFEDILNEEIF